MMEELIKDCLIIGLKSKGFALDFEAMADISGGFECYIFSNTNHVAILTGENAGSKRRGGKPKMVYRQYCCRIGDDESLRRFLESEDILGNPSLLNGEFGGLFMTLLNKVKSYGTRNSELLIRPMKNNDLSRNNVVINQHSTDSKVVRLFQSDQKSCSIGQKDSKFQNHIQNSIP